MKNFIICFSLIVSLITSPCFGQGGCPALPFPGLNPAAGANGEQDWSDDSCLFFWCNVPAYFPNVAYLCFSPGIAWLNIKNLTLEAWNNADATRVAYCNAQINMNRLAGKMAEMQDELTAMEIRCLVTVPRCDCCDLYTPYLIGTFESDWQTLQAEWAALDASLNILLADRASLMNAWTNRPDFNDPTFCAWLDNWLGDVYDLDEDADTVLDALGHVNVAPSFLSSLHSFETNLDQLIAGLAGCCAGGGPGGDPIGYNAIEHKDVGTISPKVFAALRKSDVRGLDEIKAFLVSYSTKKEFIPNPFASPIPQFEVMVTGDCKCNKKSEEVVKPKDVKSGIPTPAPIIKIAAN